MKYAIWFLVFLLVIFHHDFWNWDSRVMVFGFMPIGLFYHVCISVAAAFVWFLACQFAWPVADNDPELVEGVEEK